MYKKATFSLSLAALLSVGLFVEGESVRCHSSVGMSDEEVDERIKEARERMEELKSTTDRRSVVEEQRERLRVESASDRIEAMQRSHKAREELEERMEGYRVGMAEGVAEKLEERAKERVNEIGKRINEMNMEFSRSYMSVLNDMEDVASNIEKKGEVAEEKTGEDLVSFYETIIEIREDISIARSEALNQKGKFYEITIESEDVVSETMREAIEKLRDDHQKLRSESINSIKDNIKEAHTVISGALN